jgi:imipenem/basic amino acid-specific outer membrane pore
LLTNAPLAIRLLTYGGDGGGTIWLANSVQSPTSIVEDERSWQARYELDMATFGVPGLSFMTAISGDNIVAGVAQAPNEG